MVIRPTTLVVVVVVAVAIGSVLVAGVQSESNVQSQSNNFNVLPTYAYGPWARDRSACAVMAGNMVIYGGTNSTVTRRGTVFDDVWLWDNINLLWFFVDPNPGPMPAGRYWHTAVSLVLSSSVDIYTVYGGRGAFGEVFGDIWGLVGSNTSGLVWEQLAVHSPLRPPGRYGHTATRIGNAMFIYGGIIEYSKEPTNDVIAYDATTNDWLNITVSIPAPAAIGATSASIGTMFYVCGGVGIHDEKITAMYAANITDGVLTTLKFTKLASYAARSFVPQQLLATSENQLYAMGSGLEEMTLAVYWYNMENDSWSAVPLEYSPMNRILFTACATPNNSALIFGGQLQSGRVNAVNDLWEFSFDALAWSPNDPPRVPPERRYQSAVLIQSPTLGWEMIIYGGSSIQYFNSLSDTWALVLQQSAWRSMAYMPNAIPPARRSHSAVVLLDPTTGLELMTVFGGWTDSGPCDQTYYYNAFSRLWQFPEPPIAPAPRASHRAIAISNSEMVLFGGAGEGTNIYNDTWLFDIRTTKWVQLNPNATVVPRGRFAHSANYIASRGAMIIYGGECTNERNLVNVFNDTWSFSMARREWTQMATTVLGGSEMTGPMARSFHVSVTVGEKIIIFGGTNALGENLNDMWELDLLQNQWRIILTTNTPEPCSGSTAVMTALQHSNDTAGMMIYGGEGLFSRTLLLQPGCNPGFASADYAHMQCTPCVPGMFQNLPGQKTCFNCPGRSYNSLFAATEINSCKECVPNTCNGHGECTIVAGTSGVSMCSCDFGYEAIDDCYLPLVPIQVIGSLLVIAMVVGLVLMVRRAGKYRRKQKQYQRLLNHAENDLAVTRRAVRDLEETFLIEPAAVKLREKIDTGSFGEVWKAHWAGRVVSVKILKQAVMDTDIAAREEFEKEVRFLRKIRHPNVVFFYGYGGGLRGDAHCPFLVTEYLERGSLRSILHDKQTLLGDVQKLRFALDAAKGLRFLHGLSPPVIHRDVKSANFVVSEQFCVKVADFGTATLIDSLQYSARRGNQDGLLEDSGLSAEDECTVNSMTRRTVTSNIAISSSGTVTGNSSVNATQNNSMRDTPALTGFTVQIPESRENGGLNQPLLRDLGLGASAKTSSGAVAASIMTRGVGTLLWQAPEILMGRDYSAPCDVYSFGIVLWEIFTRELPFSEYDTVWAIESAVCRGERPSLPLETHDDVAQLISECWAQEPDERPDFKLIVTMIDSMLESPYCCEQI